MSDTIVDIPGAGRVSFPASMSDADIESAIKTKILPEIKGTAAGKASGVGSYIDNIVRQAAGGAAFGFADEAASGLDALTGRAASYGEALTQNRAQDKAFAAENPIASTVANVAGNVGTAALTLPAKLVAMGPSIVGNVLKGGAVGAGLGGVQGFGEGEDGIINRITHGLMSAGAGAIGGGAVPVLGAVGRQIAESPVGKYVGEKIVAPVARTLGDLTGNPVAARSVSAAAPDGGAPSFFSDVAQNAGNTTQRGAVDRIATAMQREGMTPEQIVAKLEQLGPEGVLADVGPQFLSEARRANTLPGETKTVAKNVLEGRDRQAGNRLTAAFEGDQPPPSAFALRGEGQAFDKNASAIGEQAYGAMSGEKLRVSGDMQKIMQEAPAIGETLQQIQQDAARTGTKLNPIELVDRLKQQLNKSADAAFMSGKAVNKQDVGNLADRFEKAFWAANPKAQEAAAAYRQAKSLPEFFDAGASLLARDGASENAIGKSAPALADLLAGANQQQVVAGRAGATNAARGQAQESTRLARALAQRIDESAPVQSKIGQLYEPSHASDILRQAGAEKTFANTSNEILRGSKTADKLAEALDTGNAAFRVTPGGVTPRFVEHLKNIPELLVKPNEGVRNEIGRLTLSMNPAENRRILALAAELLNARARGTPIRTAIGASSTSEVVR